MNNEDEIKKSLAKIARDEIGWRKLLKNAEGSFSRNFAQKNLNRLSDEQEMLLNRRKTLEMRRQYVMKMAIADGIFTDNVRDRVCEELVANGWLTQAETVSDRRGKRNDRVYQPTEKAIQDWNRADTEPRQ